MVAPAVVALRQAQASCAPLELTFRSREAWQNGLRRFLPLLDCSVANAESFQCSAVVGRLRGNAVAELRAGASRLVRRAIHGRRRASPSRSPGCSGPNSGTLDAGAWTSRDYAGFPTRRISAVRSMLGTASRRPCGAVAGSSA